MEVEWIWKELGGRVGVNMIKHIIYKTLKEFLKIHLKRSRSKII